MMHFMRTVLLALFLFASTFCFSQGDTALYLCSKSDDFSSVYTRVLPYESYVHLDSIQFAFYENDGAEQTIWKSGEKMKVFEGTWSEDAGVISVENNYNSRKGLFMDICAIDTSNKVLPPIEDINGNHITECFLEIKSNSLIFGLEQVVYFDSIPKDDSFRICMNTGSICSNWEKVPEIKGFKLVLGIDFDPGGYFGFIDKYLFFRKSEREIGLFDVIYVD